MNARRARQQRNQPPPAEGPTSSELQIQLPDDLLKALTQGLDPHAEIGQLHMANKQLRLALDLALTKLAEAVKTIEDHEAADRDREMVKRPTVVKESTAAVGESEAARA